MTTLEWPLMSEVISRANVKQNNNLNTNEKMPNSYHNSVIYYEKILAEVAKTRSQLNFDSEAGRKTIAEEIVKEKMPNNRCCKVEQANNLLDQIISEAEYDDTLLKDYWISKNQGEKAIGESFVVFHLKSLKKLLNE